MHVLKTMRLVQARASFLKKVTNPKTELTHLTVVLKGGTESRTQFGRDASRGLATFKNHRACAQKSMSSLICKLQQRINILEANVEKLNVFCDAISKCEHENVKFSIRKPTISKQKSIYICNLQVRMRKKHLAQGVLQEVGNPGKVRYLFIRNSN